MKIGLVRHFRVQHPPPRGRITAEQFAEWVDGYDRGSLQLDRLPDFPVRWDHCVSSDMLRACGTARMLYRGEAGQLPELREIPIAPVSRAGRLPHALWLILGRLAWLASHPSQPETRQQTAVRARDAADRLEAFPRGAQVLVVTHGAFMKVLAAELRRRGYRGARMGHPRNGVLYLYERDEQ